MKPVKPDLDDREASLLWLRNAGALQEVNPIHFVEIALRWRHRWGILPDDVEIEFGAAGRAIVVHGLVAGGMTLDDAVDLVTRHHAAVHFVLDDDSLSVTWENLDPPEEE